MARVVNKPRLEPAQEPQQVSKKEQKQQNIQNKQEILNRTPGIETLKDYISTILLSDSYEEILTEMVDKLLKDEQMALTEASKADIKLQKKMLGTAFSNVVAYGDQQGLLYLLSDRLGYRRRY